MTPTPAPLARLRLGGLSDAVAAAIADLGERAAIRRMAEGDHTLWSDDPTEISDRLGWLEVAAEVLDAGERLDSLAAEVRSDGITHIVVLGMGGSSLFPEVLSKTHPSDGERPTLSILDSTDPTAVARVTASSPEETTLFVVASKSGTTIETRSHLEFFWDRIGRGDRFVAITDPGSELAALARHRGFRAVFENRSDIGGRYSALSWFGLVPAALAGLDWRALARAGADAERSLTDPDPAVNAGLVLGAVLGAAAVAGRDKVTLLTDPRISSFGLWLEQLLAESTGKEGRGIIPIVGEPVGSLDLYGDDRLFVVIGEPDHPIGPDVLADAGHPMVEIGFDGPHDLGTQVLVWEVATAIAGAVLGINPFDQPNVAEAKEATARVLAGDVGGVSDALAIVDSDELDGFLAGVGPGDYIAVQIYADPESPAVAVAEELRLMLRDRHRVATTLGVGPRFLHSTGQLHKGGPPSGVFLQIVANPTADAPIPGEDLTFGALMAAQADGDLLTLRSHGLRAVRTTIDAIRRLDDIPATGA